MEVPVELRQLRYFVAVAEELHFGRAAERLHMSQSPLSRAIRDLERELGVVLFIRTTRRVELTAAGSALLERARRALAEVDGAIAEARRAARPDGNVLSIGHTPFSRAPAARIADDLVASHPGLRVQLDEEVTPDSLRRVGAGELTAAVVLETPAAARRFGVRVDALKDEPLLAAIPESHAHATAGAVPLGVLAAERVLLPREPTGRAFNAWLEAVLRAAGLELRHTLRTLSAPWDRRMLPVAHGEAVSVLVAEWAGGNVPGVVALPFDPPINLPLDLASAGSPGEGAGRLVDAAARLRDAEGWLTQRPPRIELPDD